MEYAAVIAGPINVSFLIRHHPPTRHLIIEIFAASFTTRHKTNASWNPIQRR
jgi:hypothetical protein